MRTLIAVLCLAVAAQAAYEQEWQAFKAKYNKQYSAAEESFRFSVFVENSKLVEEHNQLHEQGLSTFTMAVNQYADMLSTEFAAQMNGYKSGMKKHSAKVYQPAADIALPDTVDWRTKGAVTGVKDQGQCGSCWAFSSTGGLEGQHFLNKGNLPSLSEQNLVDCSGSYGNMGCNGGIMDDAFKYIRDNNGIDSEASYPYTARDGTCKFTKANVAATDTGFTDIRSGSESELQTAVADVGPISVAIDASHASFQMYSGGVYNEPRCSSIRLDHGVLAAGYGTESGKDYWLVKNSWGKAWGEAGYIKMSRNENNQCGIATEASYPTV